MSSSTGTRAEARTTSAVVQVATGGYDVLQVRDVPVPEVGPHDIAIAVEACGLNFSDLLARIGMYPDAPPAPAVLGYEVAGTITEVGADAGDWQVGDRVMAATRFGGQAAQVVTAADNVLRAPEGLTFAECAAVPVAFATAYAALSRYGGLQAGERVLIHSAAGGVGSAAVQLAAHLGAEVHAVASAGKHDWVRQLGAATVYDSGHRLEPEGEFDLILDPLGPRSFRSSLAQLRAGGRLVVYGVTQLQSGERRSLLHILRQLRAIPGVMFLDLMRTSRSVIGFNALSVWDAHGTLRPLIEPVLPLLERGAVRPQVDSIYPFAEAGEAHRRLESRQARGKVVLVPDDHVPLEP